MRLISLLIIISAISCVSTKKYNELVLAQDVLLLENRRLGVTSQEYLDLRTEYAVTKKQTYNAEKGLKDLMAQYETLNQQYNDLRSHYEGDRTINDLATSPALQALKMKKELEQLKSRLEQKQRQVWDLEMELDKRNQEYVPDSNIPMETETNTIVEASGDNTSKMLILHEELEVALQEYLSSNLTIKVTNNEVGVLLPQDMLFEKSSKNLAEESKVPLLRLANILKEYTDILITIEGHTDSDGREGYNWDLSVDRATSVVKAMIELGLQPGRLIASGRSHYDPLDTNTTSEGKARNRRVEIIISEVNK